MDKQDKIIICLVAVIICIIIVIAGVLAYQHFEEQNKQIENLENQLNDTNSKLDQQETEASANSHSSGGHYQLKIIYGSSLKWTGAAGIAGSTSSYNGHGSTIIDLGSGSIASACIQKSGGGNSVLTVQLIKDGKVIKQSSTSSPYGTVTVAG